MNIIEPESSLREEIQKLKETIETSAIPSKSVPSLSRSTSGQFFLRKPLQILIQKPNLGSILLEKLHAFQIHELKREEILNESKLRSRRISEQAEPKLEIIRKAAQEKIDVISQSMHQHIAKLSKRLQGSIFKSDKSYYIIESVNYKSANAKVSKLTDTNGIFLSQSVAQTKNLSTLLKGQIVPKDKVGDVLDELVKKELTVFYQLVPDGETEFICLPVKLKPDVPMNDYKIKSDGGQIQQVKNRWGEKVKFAAIEMSKECEFVHGTTVQIYTSELSEHVLNILHVHLQDMNEAVSFEAVYILPDQSKLDYSDWSTDANSVMLRYKILVKSGQIETVLYNTGQTTEELPFEEMRVKCGQKLKIDNDNIVEVQNIPTGLLVRDWAAKDKDIQPIYNLQEPHFYCRKRSIVDLPGCVDVSVFLGEVPGHQLTLPICECLPLEDEDRNKLENILREQEETASKQKDQAMQKLNSLLEELRKDGRPDQELLEEFRGLETVLGNEVEELNKAVQILSRRMAFSRL